MVYQDIEIPENSVVYCDIPYKGTNCAYYGGFDYERFYKWSKEQKNIFISEYGMPKDFIEIANKEKTILSSSKGAQKGIERLYTFGKYESNQIKFDEVI